MNDDIRRIAIVVTGLLCAASFATTASAQAKPEDLVKQRKAAMTLIGKYIGPIGAMVQGKLPYDAAVVARNAGYAETLAKMPWDGFNPSTEGVKETRAKPEIYRDQAKFNQASETMQGEIVKLAAAARGGDEAAVKAAFGSVGKACKACHDDYRRE